MRVTLFRTPAARASRALRFSLGLLALGSTSVPGFAQTTAVSAATAGVAAPAITRFGHSLGLESPSTQLTLTVWLNMHNRAAFDARVKALYTPGSPTFHQWMNDADMKAYAPTAAEVAAVKAELKAHNLTVQSSDPMGLSVRFQGKVSDIESSFHTQISRYTVQGEMVRTTSSLPQLSGGAAGLVHHVAGLNSLRLKPMIHYPMNPKTGKQFAGVPTARAGADGLVYASQCFYLPSSITLSGVNSNDGTTPVLSKFNGLSYGADPANTAQGTLAPCGYSPAQVQTFYGLKKAYDLGYTGTGQTIVIIDSYLQPNALANLTEFSKLYKLPAPTTSTYKEYNPYGATMPGSLYGTDGETDLDLQWAHAIAPGAKLALVQTFSEDEEDQQAGILYAVTQHLGNVISLSYGYPESFTGPLALDVFSQVVEIAAAEGIAFQASSGDSGDDTVNGNGLDVDAPADSPYATAVGGTSIGTLPGDASTVYTVGWGNNIGFLSFTDTQLVDPPLTEFYAGSGGGTSAYFSKPAYQAALPGKQRLLPDVSALADPFTGGEFVTVDPTTGEQVVEVVGGTSLASPIFSGIWALVVEAAGGPLGQAAPYVAAAPASIIKDVVPFVGGDNVTGTITDPGGTTAYSASTLSQPLGTTTQFVSALWDAGQGEYLNLTFGTDTSLKVTKGWDNVTGYGTPDVGAYFTETGVKPKQ